MAGKDRAILLVGSAENCPDLVYATGFRAPDPVVCLQKGHNKYLVVPQLELGRAQRQAIGTQVYSPTGLGLSPTRRRRFSEWALGLLRLAGVRWVTVSSSFPHGIAVKLQRAGIRISVARKELLPERAVKKAHEISCIRQSQQAAVIAMRSAVAIIAKAHVDREGHLVSGRHKLTSERLRHEVAKVLLSHDCICKELIVAGGLQGADPHERGTGVLRAHEAIVMDIFPQHMGHGYWGDLTRTVIKGHPSPKLRRMYNAVRAAQTAALTHVKPGVKCATVHRAAVEEFGRRRMKTAMVDGKAVGFIHSTGHGVGLSIHEAPGIGPGETRLRSGHVITVEPGLYYPDIGGIRIEDTVVVTPTGWRYLVPCEKRFEV